METLSFSMQRTCSILEATPGILESYLGVISPDWLTVREHEKAWSPLEILNHLILGEETDWIPRALIMLSDAEDKSFEPFDMEGHLLAGAAVPVEQGLARFRQLRHENLQQLMSWNLSPEDLERTGLHPELGRVYLRQHLATWVVHDLSHLAQLARTMVRAYGEHTGPWKKFHSLLR
ncbi:MAG: DinB family protein [Bacteroidia bacterium]|nr:DinB family protein [Bacteroidia bacterium]